MVAPTVPSRSPGRPARRDRVTRSIRASAPPRGVASRAARAWLRAWPGASPRRSAVAASRTARRRFAARGLAGSRRRRAVDGRHGAGAAPAARPGRLARVRPARRPGRPVPARRRHLAGRARRPARARRPDPSRCTRSVSPWSCSALLWRGGRWAGRSAAPTTLRVGRPLIALLAGGYAARHRAARARRRPARPPDPNIAVAAGRRAAAGRGRRRARRAQRRRPPPGACARGSRLVWRVAIDAGRGRGAGPGRPRRAAARRRTRSRRARPRTTWPSRVGPDAAGWPLLLLLNLLLVPERGARRARVRDRAGLRGRRRDLGVASAGPQVGALPPLSLFAAVPGAVRRTPATYAVLAIPLLAGIAAGLVAVRRSRTLAPEMCALAGLGAGLVAGVLCMLAAWAASGGIGTGPLAAIGPTGMAGRRAVTARGRRGRRRDRVGRLSAGPLSRRRSRRRRVLRSRPAPCRRHRCGASRCHASADRSRTDRSPRTRPETCVPDQLVAALDDDHEPTVGWSGRPSPLGRCSDPGQPVPGQPGAGRTVACRTVLGRTVLDRTERARPGSATPRPAHPVATTTPVAPEQPGDRG